MKTKRQEISPAVKRIDRAMTHFIKVGGIGVIAAVFAIFVFILSQIFPLFQKASVGPEDRRWKAPHWEVPPGDYVALATDEWTESPFLLEREGAFVFADLPRGGKITRVLPPYPADKKIVAAAYRAKAGSAAVGTSDGQFALVKVGFEPEYTAEAATGATAASAGADAGRRIVPKVEPGAFHSLGKPGHPILRLALAASDNARLVAAVQEVEAREEIHAALLTRKRSLRGGESFALQGTHDLTPLVAGKTTHLMANSRADSVVVVTDSRRVHYLFLDGAGFVSRQVFEPFADESIALADFLYGDDSIVFVSASGKNTIWSLYSAEKDAPRLFSQTKALDDLPPGIRTFTPSLRNKAFLVGGDRFASLRYGTTADTRWEDALPFDPRMTALSGKFDRMVFLDTENRLHLRAINDPHPEAGLKAFFGKIWYENAPRPAYDWQSTGATDDFEPKLSMVPLLVGTLKGTLYAMLFSVPMALLAALYASQFATPRLRRVVKPAMEIMASLPSVILGFLAALWLAPLLETRVPSVLLVLIFVPAAVLLFGSLWGRLDYSIRRRIPAGTEIAAVIPLLVLATGVAWSLGPWLESHFFVVTDPATGVRTADFRLWWPSVTGLPYEQRNSLVVGFMMGFAVIPIVFTIAEDALSNVPSSFRSSSLALGASRWQTAIRVILPTASAGIFSAVMIGFGRAVGETMIVLMATGNTPILEFNLFSGMRTLSANIAVELPEAPHHGTLYRALFLGAMLLFLMTFVVNTVAELLRHHLREKYKAV